MRPPPCSPMEVMFCQGSYVEESIKFPRVFGDKESNFFPWLASSCCHVYPLPLLAYCEDKGIENNPEEDLVRVPWTKAHVSFQYHTHAFHRVRHVKDLPLKLRHSISTVERERRERVRKLEATSPLFQLPHPLTSGGSSELTWIQTGLWIKAATDHDAESLQKLVVLLSHEVERNQSWCCLAAKWVQIPTPNFQKSSSKSSASHSLSELGQLHTWPESGAIAGTGSAGTPL